MFRRTSRSPVHPLPLVLAAFVLAGCWELEKTVQVNPDGSARVRVDWETTVDALEMEGLGQDEDAARRKAAGIVRSARGVEVWSDVSWAATEDGVRFSGTAYVPDLSRFFLEDGSGNPMGFGWLALRQEEGKTIIEYRLGEEEDGRPLPELGEEEALEEGRQMITELRQARQMGAGLLIDSRHGIALRVPGRATEVAGFTEAEGGLYEFSLEGEEILDAMGAMIDEGAEGMAERLREAAAEGMDEGELFSSLMADHLPQLPARIAFEPGDARFDYESEVAAAEEAYPALVERLGLEAEAESGAAGAEMAQPMAVTPAPAEPEPVRVDGPPKVIYLRVGKPGTSSFEDGTQLRITLPSLAGQAIVGLASESPAGLSITDDRGRDLIAAGQEAFDAWQAANPNTFTTRTPASWELGSTRGDASIPYIEINLWATPSPGASSLRVQGTVEALGPPETTATASFAPDRIADGAVLELGGVPVTLSHTASWSSGGPRYLDYAVEGDVVVAAVRQGGQVIWEAQAGGGGGFSILEELPSAEPIELEFGLPSSVGVPLDLRFGLGLASLP